MDVPGPAVVPEQLVSLRRPAYFVHILTAHVPSKTESSQQQYRDDCRSMAYNAVAQRERDAVYDEDEHSTSGSPPPQLTSSSPFQPLQVDFDSFGSASLFMEHEQHSLTPHGFNTTVQSIVSKPTQQRYEMLEEDDYTHISPQPSPILSAGRGKMVDQSLPVQPPRQSHVQATTSADNNQSVPPGARPATDGPVVRTAPGGRTDLRHPTPDLQSIQGAHVANVENLEKTAEKLSMTSSIDNAIRQMHNELKRSDSRRSSLLASPIEMPAVARQFSNPSSILEINSAARSGGFSPGGFNMISPQHSFSKSGRGRSASKSSKFGSRPEPELEGRPLDSFVNCSTSSPHLSRSASIAEEQEKTTTITPPVLPAIRPLDPPINLHSRADESAQRPTTSGSTNTLEQAEKLFNDFDGEHYNPQSRDASQIRPKLDARRVSSGNRLSTAMPLSYADPSTGQQMVYYPAPVPMMLNLPQKLSKAPSAMTRDKRRSQVMSSIPPAARKSAIWLPDVLEDVESLKLNFAGDDTTEQQEYMPQHQRRSMGGRRTVKDLEHLPPQLRASTFFEPQGISQIVEVKGESAVATLDSILDASAFAPVSAFTDHAFAGRLGAEVYGAATKRASRPISQVPAKNIEKRKSLSNILLSKRASSSELLSSQPHEQRRATMSDALGRTKLGGSPQLAADEDYDLSGGAEDDPEADESEENDEDEGHPDDIIYHGAPTTLLAELQIRKQQQKLRTRPLTTMYPNGMHSTLLELDAVAQVEKKARKQKRVALAWEDPDEIGLDESGDENEDVPLAMLFPHKSAAHIDRTRPMGLMERREMEDNEPLSQRRDRLQGKPPRAMARASTMIGVSTVPVEDEGETLAQRVQRLRAQGGTATGLPTTRPVSGDFTNELMSQFGGEAMDGAKRDAKGKGKDTSGTHPAEEEETLGQRRKRLQAEREAREKEVGAGADTEAVLENQPALKTKLSMADILQAHPAAGASRSSSYNLRKTGNGLLGMHERQSAQRTSTMQQLQAHQQKNGGFMNGNNRDSGAGMMLPQHQTHSSGFAYGTAPNGHNFATPYQNQSTMNLGYYPQQQMLMPMPFANPYTAMGYSGLGIGYQNPMAASLLQMQSLGQELNPRQMDMVERWRQSVMQ